ncbi:MAG: type II secretion system protein GspL [Gammaproteobacteria bacterium]|nr:type II secretion system protein GspL [Gammaproteobacteria bacterium]
MRAKIFIRFDAASPDEAGWLRLDEPARRDLVVRRGSWQEAAAAAAGCRVIVLAPGTEVLLTVAMVPGGNRRQVANAIPFALEEQVASDVEETHFAPGERREDGRINTAVVLKGRMDGWLERLRGLGIEPDAIVPEPLALPWSADAWTVLCEGDKVLVRNGRQGGFAAEADNLATLLRLALNEAGEARPERLRVMRGADDPSPRPDLSALELEVAEETIEEPALAVLARGYDEQVAIDLLQGPYSRREQLGRLWRPWLPAAALAAAWLLVLGGMTVADYVRLDGENKALTQEIEKTYLQAFPEARKVVNARAQMEEHLKELRGGGAGGEDFLGLLASIGSRLKETPGAELQRVSYNEGSVDIALLIADLQSLDQLKQRLSAQGGLSVDIQSAASRDGRVEALLQIKGKTS